MHQDASELEKRFTDLQSQIDRLTGAGARGQHDVLSQVQQLQQTIEHEWRALRLIHEEPVRQLREQAASLAEICVATASSAVNGFDRTEARLAGLEAGLHERLTALAGEMRSAVAALRAASGGQPPALAVPPQWPLDDVVRLHNQIRESSGAAAGAAEDTAPAPEPRRLAKAPDEIVERMDALERGLADGQAEITRVVERTTRAGRLWWVAVALVVAAIGGSAFSVVSRIRREAGAAEARAIDAERLAKDQVAAVRAEAAREVADARATALRAQTIANVLAAPDLARFYLVGGAGNAQFAAQALWSRSRGFVFSGSRLPPPPPDSIYQIWLYSGADAVSAGVFAPDSDGRFTLAIDTPLRVPPPIGGVLVTTEASGGAERPTGPRLMGRAE